MTTLDYALRYANQGWAVFPAHGVENGCCTCRDQECRSPGKHPLTSGGFKIASTDPDIIREWWSQWPFANVGIATGSASGVIVVDIDVGPEKEGEISLQTLESQVGALPRDAVVRTGSGGMHIYFQMPDMEISGNTGKLGKNIDVRANGGYVIAPPSTHISGNNYEWINAHV